MMSEQSQWTPAPSKAALPCLSRARWFRRYPNRASLTHVQVGHYGDEYGDSRDDPNHSVSVGSVSVGLEHDIYSLAPRERHPRAGVREIGSSLLWESWTCSVGGQAGVGPIEFADTRISCLFFGFSYMILATVKKAARRRQPSYNPPRGTEGLNGCQMQTILKP
jgi:hypothetical protein